MKSLRQLQWGLLASTILLSAVCGCVEQSHPQDIVDPTLTVRTNSLGIRMTLLPGGTFRMGDNREPMSRPVHSVRVSRFWIAQIHVTNAQFDRFKKRPRYPESLADDQPAVRVSWAEADAFCRWLSKKEKKRYHLPTEAQWEYAARGGLKQKNYPWGNEGVDGRARFNQTTTCPVGMYPPNRFGLYDMVGNAEQWVGDWYDPEYYANSPLVDPQGPKKPAPRDRFRVLRGGGHDLFGFTCAQREIGSVDSDSGAGFRIAMDA